MRLRKLIIVLIIVLSCTPVWARSGWQFVCPMPHGRYVHDATLGPDGRIYVMGGMVFEVTEKRLLPKKYNNGRYSNLVYDRKKDTWEYLMPVPGWYLSSDFLMYDKKKKIWDWIEYRHGMKIPDNARRTDLERQGNGVSIVTGRDGKIYWTGGMGQFEWIGRGEDRVLSYNPLNDSWTRVSGKEIRNRLRTVYHTDIPRMLERRIDHEAVITSDGKIYVIGGYRLEKTKDSQAPLGYTIESVTTNTMECYDPKTTKWEYKKPLNLKGLMRFAAVVGPDDKIYVFGGAAGMATMRSTPILDTVRVYDPETDTWSLRKPMPMHRKSHAAVLGADGKIYIMGGSSEVYGPPLSDVFIYDPVTDTWKEGPAMNRRRAVPRAVATPDGKIYVIGGTDVGAYKARKKLNYFLPKEHELYTGKVQDTVEVLDVFRFK